MAAGFLLNISHFACLFPWGLIKLISHFATAAWRITREMFHCRREYHGMSNFDVPQHPSSESQWMRPTISYWYEQTHTHKQTPTHIQKHKRTNRQTHKHTGTQTHKHTSTQTDQHTTTQTRKLWNKKANHAQGCSKPVGRYAFVTPWIQAWWCSRRRQLDIGDGTKYITKCTYKLFANIWKMK
jgi:hypothetical protein